MTLNNFYISLVELYGYDKLLEKTPPISEQLMKDFLATTFSDDEEMPETAAAEETADKNLAEAELVISDSDVTMISDDEKSVTLGYESDRSVEEEPTAEDRAFLDDEDTQHNDSPHAALLQNSRIDDDNDFMSRLAIFYYIN